MQYEYNNHLLDDISPVALECKDILSHVCVLSAELEVQKYNHGLSFERFKHAFGAHWKGFGGMVLLPKVAKLDLLFSWPLDE